MNYKTVTRKVIVNVTAFVVILVSLIILIEIMNILTLTDYKGGLRV